MPWARLVCITVAIWCDLPSRIRLATAGTFIRISTTGTRPTRSMRGKSDWATTPRKLSDNITRICACWPSGKTSIMRSSVLMALLVCSVAKTRWPVSAAVIASEIVSRSRISPTRIMSGSSRNAARRAAWNDFV